MRTRYKEKKTTVLTKWKKDLEMTENDPPKKRYYISKRVQIL